MCVDSYIVLERMRQRALTTRNEHIWGKYALQLAVDWEVTWSGQDSLHERESCVRGSRWKGTDRMLLSGRSPGAENSARFRVKVSRSIIISDLHTNGAEERRMAVRLAMCRPGRSPRMTVRRCIETYRTSERRDAPVSWILDASESRLLAWSQRTVSNRDIARGGLCVRRRSAGCSTERGQPFTRMYVRESVATSLSVHSSPTMSVPFSLRRRDNVRYFSGIPALSKRPDVPCLIVTPTATCYPNHCRVYERSPSTTNLVSLVPRSRS